MYCFFFVCVLVLFVISLRGETNGTVKFNRELWTTANPPKVWKNGRYEYSIHNVDLSVGLTNPYIMYVLSYSTKLENQRLYILPDLRVITHSKHSKQYDVVDMALLFRLFWIIRQANWYQTKRSISEKKSARPKINLRSCASPSIHRTTNSTTVPFFT